MPARGTEVGLIKRVIAQYVAHQRLELLRQYFGCMAVAAVIAKL
tara:strand:- start:215 stop:346 length:132 start_codon:yes stop_codon:yes gene_type:complete